MMRATAKLTAKLERGLLAYATAASAAGIGMLALAQPAEAKVVYTPANDEILVNHTIQLDLNKDGSTDFKLKLRYVFYTSTAFKTLFVSPIQQSNQILGKKKGIMCAPFSYCASVLRAGSRIGPDDQFPPSQPEQMVQAVRTAVGSVTCSGQWRDIARHYLGLKFQFNGETHYGWARLNVHCDRNQWTITGKLTGYAYETIPDKPIVAGNRGSTTGQGPEAEPVSLGQFALGAAGRERPAAKIH